MTQLHLNILALLYLAAGLVYLVGSLRSILEENHLRLIHGVRLMYAFIYGLLPFIIFIEESQGERNLAWYNYSTEGILYLYAMFAFSVLGYIAILFCYGLVRRGATESKSGTYAHILSVNQLQQDDNHLFLCGIFTLIISFLAMLLWTNAYGSIYNYILNAARIRSGYGVSNPYAFMKYLVQVVKISMYALLAAFLASRARGRYNRIYGLCFLLSVAGTVTYLLTTDSRTTIAVSFIGVLVILLKYRKNSAISRYLLLAAIVVVAALFLTITADTFTRYFRKGIWSWSGSSITDSIITEFEFIYSAQAYVVNNLFTGTLELKFMDDALIAITKWIPDSILPFSLPDTVWAYNTANLSLTTSGTYPTDLLSSGIYYLGLPGVVLWPASLGLSVGFVDLLLIRHQSSMYTDPYYALMMGIFVHSISHNQMSTMALSLFPAFFFALLSWGLKSIRFSRFTPAEEDPQPATATGNHSHA